MFEAGAISAGELAGKVAAVANEAVRTTGLVGRIGVDVVDIRRLEHQVSVVGEPFVAKLLTPAELAHCAGRIEQLATRIAAKEAAAKALGTGFRGVRWHEIEVVTAHNGAPSLRLADAAATRASVLGLDALELSSCHEGGFAFAVVVGVSRPGAALAPHMSTRGDELDQDRAR